MNSAAYERVWFIFGLVSVPVWLTAFNVFGADKLVDQTLFKHDPSAGGVYRWSEAALLNLDGKEHLMMLVTAFGHGGHDHTAANILEFHSHDGGLTWTPLEEAKVFQKNIGTQNVMSPTLLRLDNGDILFFFMVKNPPTLTDTGPWMRRSTDSGKTWSEPVRLPYRGYGGPAPNRAIQHSSGRIILPCWVSMDKLGSTHAYSFYSDDRGKTWKQSPLITTPRGSTGRRTNPAAEEPAVIELKDGRLMMLVRCYLKSIFVSYSSDRGATWSQPARSGIPSPGSMPLIKRLPDNNILLIWNYAPIERIEGPFPRTQITAAISTGKACGFSRTRATTARTVSAGPSLQTTSVLNPLRNMPVVARKPSEFTAPGAVFPGVGSPANCSLTCRLTFAGSAAAAVTISTSTGRPGGSARINRRNACDSRRPIVRGTCSGPSDSGRCHTPAAAVRQ